MGIRMDHANLTDHAVVRASDAEEALTAIATTPQEKFLQAIGHALTSIACSMAAAQVKELD